MLSGQKKTVSINNQNLTISDYCNQPVLKWKNLSCRSLWATKTISAWKWVNSPIYRVVDTDYFRYDDGVDLLNQKLSNGNSANNPVQIPIANVCVTSVCISTQEQAYSVFETTPINSYSGAVSSFSMQEFDTPVITSIHADPSRKTNSVLQYGASFIDRIPKWCTSDIYTYNPKILTWNWGTIIDQFTDSNDPANIPKNTKITTNKVGEVLTWSIAESITLSSIGLRKIEMNIADAWANSSTKTTGMIEIIPGDIAPVSASIVSKNTLAKYYPGDTLMYVIIMKDAAGNIIKDKPANFSHPTQDSYITYQDPGAILPDSITGEYVLRIKISQPISFIENFHISLPYWDDFWADIINSNPQVLDVSTRSRIGILDPNLAGSDFVISCSQGPITLQATCSRDNLSWCKTGANQSITFSSESDNGAEGFLSSSDNAGNIKQYRYIMKHIDKTAPVGILKLGSNTLVTGMSMLATNNTLAMSINHAPPPGCSSSINYALTRPDILWSGPYNFIGNISWSYLNFGIANFTKNGVGQVVYTLTDSAGNSTVSRKNITIYPASPSVIESSITLVGPLKDSLYANASSKYTYKLTLKDQFGNAITGKLVNNINQEWGAKTIKTDMIDPASPVGDDAIFEEWPGINTTNSNGEVFFTVKSLAPGIFSEKFKISMHTTWDNNYLDTGTVEDIFIHAWKENSFKKTFTWALSIITSPFKLTHGTTLTMKLGVTQKNTVSWYNIQQFKDQVSIIDTVNQEIQDKQDALNLDNNPLLDFRIEAKTDVWVSLSPGVVIQGNPIISYTLPSWQSIKYRLSATDSSYDNTYISLGGAVINNNIKVVGALQGQGKQSLAWQKTNFSDISKSNIRAIIRKNAYTLIRWRTSSDTVVGGVKYHEGDYDLSWEPVSGYETLVVNNGNLTISSNFNTSGKKFGIIVLRDDATKINLGNIYIQPGVRYIQSAIYADGGMISTGFWNDIVGNYLDSAERTNTLSKQLVINGALFTRNTIGWAIRGSSGKFILPGGSLISNFPLAMMYDLNYLRRGNEWYNVNGLSGTKDYNKWNTDNVVITSNPNLQRDPPKGFKN